jgi:RNA polymerase sigma factor (sigma-70 family)
MDDEPKGSPFQKSDAEEMKREQPLWSVLRAAEQVLPRILAYSNVKLDDGIDAAMVRDLVVDAAMNAKREGPVRDYQQYLFKSFVRKAVRVLRRASKMEYRDPEDLASIASDPAFVEKLDRKIQLEEAIALMDDKTREIYALETQGYKFKEIGSILGMSEDAVRKHYKRGVERVKRLTQEGPKNEPGPTH